MPIDGGPPIIEEGPVDGGTEPLSRIFGGPVLFSGVGAGAEAGVGAGAGVGSGFFSASVVLVVDPTCSGVGSAALLPSIAGAASEVVDSDFVTSLPSSFAFFACSSFLICSSLAFFSSSAFTSSKSTFLT